MYIHTLDTYKYYIYYIIYLYLLLHNIFIFTT